MKAKASGDFLCHHSFVVVCKHEWDHTLQDAIKSISIQPSLIGYISNGIALCGKGCVWDARAAFGITFLFTNQDSNAIHFLILIKAIALFSADQHDKAMMLIKEVAATAFKQECSALCAALTASNYDWAIDLYSVVINLNSASDAVFANRSKAKLGKRLWMEALFDSQKVIELNSLSHTGYNLKHAVLHGAQHYDEAIKTFKIMLSKLDNSPDTQT
ncbi:hypothetical protein EDB19DRAFT_1918942 [Suillus lakei]|nr:hypothetical protein EDB19DRAFT_1918942 [Suillus lakei]